MVIGKSYSFALNFQDRVPVALRVFCLMLLASAAYGRTFYIDFTGGSNSNNGTAKTTPWSHAPGMTGCTNTCNSTVLGPGDSVIFKGGVTWSAAALPWVITAKGTSGNPIYLGVDQTWFAGASWSRPILDPNYASLSTGPGDGHGSMVDCPNCTYITIDNFEMAHFNALSKDNSNIIELNNTVGVLIKNSYLHGWRMTNGNSEGHHGAIMITFGGGDLIVDGCEIENSENVAASGTQRTNGEAVEGAAIVKNSVIHHVPTALFFVNHVENNIIYNINYPTDTDSWCTSGADCPWHTNLTYMAPSAGQSGSFSNNYVYSSASGSGVVYIEPCFASTSTNTEIDVFNNVIDNSQGAVDAITVDPESNVGTGSPCGIAKIYNNTIYSPSGAPGHVVNRSGRSFGTLELKNNHWITSATTPFCYSGSSGCGATNSVVNTNNTTSSPTTAALQGYTPANRFAPTLATNTTVGAGTNLSGSCTGNFLALCSDTTLGVTVNTHVVTGLGRAASARPSSGAWNSGAYHYGGIAPPPPTAPNPHTQLTATAQ